MEAPRKSRPWTDMSGQQKVIFVCKVIVSVISFGFIFPNLMND
jgi:hypothetical protein